MSLLAPTALLTGAAIDDRADPHLAPAGHIRLFPYPRLGLPVAPILVSRSILSRDQLLRRGRSDILWVDSRGQTLVPPFTVHPDAPVTGWLPTDGRCVWIALDATADRVVLPDILPPDIRLRTQPGTVPDLAKLINAGRAPRGGISLAEIEPTIRGDAVVQQRSTSPYELAGSQIRRIRVSGSGTVRGVRWLDVMALDKGDKPWRTWTLPHADAPRYLSVPTAIHDAKDRAARGAPLREALYDAPAAAAPSGAPLIAGPDAHEVNRVTARFAGVMETALDRLVGDTSKPAADLTDMIASRDELTGRNVGTIALNLLAAVQAAAIDPGMSRWLGFADTDADVRGMPTGTLVLYWIESWWDRAGIGKDSLLARMLASLSPNAKADLEAFRKGFNRPPPDAVKSPLGLQAVIPLLADLPPDRPARPFLGAIRTGAWNTALVPPAAARQVTLPLSDLAPAGQLAFARGDAGGPIALHEKGPDGAMLPVSAAVLPDAAEPGQGELYDRLAPPDATRYRVAQTDWFGRWSIWAEGLAAAAERPRPPRPVPELFYSPPAVPSPMHSAPLSGIVRIRVGVPLVTQLAPGSLPIANLEIVLDGAPPALVPVTAGLQALDFTRAGPALARAGTGTVTLTCRWQDTAGRFSERSPEISRTVRDPRPAPAVVLAETLAYGSRPDVTGKSRIQLAWSASPGQAQYRIYHSDETTLMTSLEREGAAGAAIRAAIAAAPDAAARAAIFVANKGRFPKTRFELVSPDALTATRFEHRVSGSLRVLVFYRVVPLSPSNVETPFGDSAMVPFAIPNSGPPATPLLSVKPIFAAGIAQPSIHIRVPRGPVAAVEYRLRRSAVESRDPVKMPIATTGTVPPLAPDAGPEGMQEVPSFVDLGGSELKSPDPLRLWTAYSWVVEVRGGSEPGSSVPGEWSPPSAPVTAAIMPPGPPAAPTDGQWNGATEVSFTHPEPLAGGSMGDYAIDLYQELPGQPIAFLASLSADAPASAGGRNPDRTGSFRFTLAGAPPSGTRYRAMITDPGGRTSPPSAEVLIP